MSLRCTKIHLHIVNWCAISINSSCSGYFVADYRYFYSDKVRMKFVYQHVIKNETDAPNGIYGRYLHVFVMLKNLNILNFKLKEPNRSKMINARWLRALKFCGTRLKLSWRALAHIPIPISEYFAIQICYDSRQRKF